MIQQAVQSHHRPQGLCCLNDHCLFNIFRFLDLDDLIRLRLVCHRINKTIEDYFQLQSSFNYDCRINGNRMFLGQYLFNIGAFDFIMKKMPNIRSLYFDRCKMLRSCLATCHYNLLDTMASTLKNLKELHIGRAFFITPESLQRFIKSFPELTHLTITLYNESSLSLIVEGFKKLTYLNLDHSVLYGYAQILEHLPSSIKTLILPLDHKNDKFEIIHSLLKGNIEGFSRFCKFKIRFLSLGPGINLERFEIDINISDIMEDKKFFDLIGQKMSNLQWFQCRLACSASANPYKIEHIDDIFDQNSATDANLIGDIDGNNNLRYHCHFEFISALHHLKNLRVLILKERDYFGDEPRCSLFDDGSLIKIFQHCPQLMMLSLSCTLRRDQNSYAIADCDRKQDHHRTINQILNGYFRKQSIRKEEERIENGSEGKLDRRCNAIERLKSLNISIDNRCSHTITDHSLSLIDRFEPMIQILELRGVRIGSRTFDSISKLNKLKFLRIDSIQLNDGDEEFFKNSFETLLHELSFESDSSELSHSQRIKPIIHFTNIPLS